MLQKVKCRFILRLFIWKNQSVLRHFVQLVAFCLTHRECVLFPLWRDFSCIALEHTHTRLGARTLIVHCMKERERTQRANNNAKLQYKENHVLQIVYNPILCALARAQNFFFLEQTSSERDRDRARKRVVKSKTTTTVDGRTSLRFI